MADIQEKILKKYGIDIAQENIFKLYKIEKSDISEEELQQAILATRKRWNQSVNGANEKIAERDRNRLEKAEMYENILRDAKLRKQVYTFYERSGDANRKAKREMPSDQGSIEFAREFFNLIGTTKKLKKQDVDFFFEYYKEQRKNKKNVLEMLSKEFKVHGLGNENNYVNEDEEVVQEGKKKDDASPFVMNLFQKITLLKIRDCAEHYQNASENEAIVRRYPTIREGMFAFLGLDKIKTIQQFSVEMSRKAMEVFTVRQEQGIAFMPLVDLFNTLKIVAEYQDVYDNFEEVKLLMKYPNLTPYMYSFVEMKTSTLKGIVNIAEREYAFRDNTDFLLNYYIPIRDHFGILNGGISSLIRKAEKRTNQNKLLNNLDEKLGFKRNGKTSLGAEILHILVYWPLFVLYFMFELTKIVFTNLYELLIPIALIIFIGFNWLFPKIWGMREPPYI